MLTHFKACLYKFMLKKRKKHVENDAHFQIKLIFSLCLKNNSYYIAKSNHPLFSFHSCYSSFKVNSYKNNSYMQIFIGFMY